MCKLERSIPPPTDICSVQVLGPYSAFGTATELLVQDASAIAEEGERLSFWQMQVCALSEAVSSSARLVTPAVPPTLSSTQIPDTAAGTLPCCWPDPDGLLPHPSVS